jgi:DNA-binding CsgD family transcriptional regulator
VLLGRGFEREVLDRLVAAAGEGQGGAILVHGEPGIGKTALLDYAVERARGSQVLRTVGNEAEMELPFAALQQLCAPAIAKIDLLPERQREALGVAFGLVTGAAPDRLLVGLAGLSLLSELAAENPVLCVVDDAQWLDAASAQAMGFVARRSATERIALVFGARNVPMELTGLQELVVAGLREPSARALLRSELPDRVDEQVLDRILAEAHGNPLALLELPRGWTPAQIAGGFALPVSVPLAGRIEASFRRRFVKLPSESRRWLLVAAAEPTGDPGLVGRAAELLGISPRAMDEADDLMDLSPRVVFRHPLVRSAIYSAASPEERRIVHRALAEATDVAVDPDRRAWHRAQAVWRPDDEVATELERRAGRAQARGGFAASAAFMERSAELTIDPGRRAGRALVAAEAKRQVGAMDAALRLATIAERGPLDDSQRAELDVLRAQVSFASDRGSDASPLLVKAAQRLDRLDVRRARDTYLDALTASLFAGRLARGAGGREVARAARAAPRCPGSPRASDLLLDGLALQITDGYAAGTPVLRRALRAFRAEDVSTGESLRWSWLAGQTAAFIWDYDSWDVLTARQLEAARASGALTVRFLTLSNRAALHLLAGNLVMAASVVEQLEAVADVIDNRTVSYPPMALAAFRGRESIARGLIDAGTKDFLARGDGLGLNTALWATAVLNNGLARYDDAFIAAERLLEDPYEVFFSPWACVELIEAASRTARGVAAAAAMDRLSQAASASGTDWSQAIEDRSRALLSRGDVAEKLYRQAIDRLTPTVLRFDLARTRLLYGEWLRRERRHRDAREQLRAAHGLFSEFGMEGFSERAGGEFSASGENPRKRTVGNGNDLTPRETQISRLVGEGADNREIAARLFISASTVEYHLHKVFRKLGVKSRTQLARRLREPTTPASKLWVS